MLYAVWATDNPNSWEARKTARAAHVARLQTLVKQNRLTLAGPMPAIDSSEPGDAGMSGSLIVAEFDSLADAREWADQDPYIEAGVYASVELKPYLKVLP